MNREKESRRNILPFDVGCLVCTRRFRNVRSWERHLSRAHGIPGAPCPRSPSALQADDHIDSVEDASPPSQNQLAPSPVTQHGPGDVDNSPVTLQSQHPHEPRSRVKAAEHRIASFCNDLREGGLPESLYASSVKSVQEIVANALKEQLLVGHSESGFDDNPTIRALHRLSTAHKLEKYVENNLPYVAPVTIFLGENEHHVKQSFQYVPLLDQLRVLLKCGEILRHVTAGNVTQRCREGVYEDVFDGSVHRDKSANVIYLAISYDDFGLVNPLGNVACKNKIAAFHFSILNAPKSVRSKTDSIFLLLLCLVPYVKKYGWGTILRPLLADLHVLCTEGLQIVDGQQTVTVYGKLSVVCGDNLAVHSLAGFVQNFTSRSPCRFCLGSPSSWQDKFCEKDFLLRDRATYDEQLRRAKDDEFGTKALESGIRGECAFNELPGFHVSDQFPPDIAHDVLEGVIPYTLSLVLTTIVLQKKYINISYLNSLLSSFFRLQSVANAPQQLRIVKGKISIKQTFSQNWALLRYLPMIIGKYIPSDCSEWILLTGLCAIVENIFARKFLSGDLAFLETKIAEWLSALKGCYPNFRLKPKFHFMIHYCSQIRKHGPLRCLWTMRYESKYSALKKLVKMNRNFRNITKTVSLKHQKHMAFVMSSKDFLREPIPEVLEHADLTVLEEVPKILRKSFAGRNVRFSAKASVNGIVYERGCVVLINDEHFEFAEVTAVCVEPDSTCLVVQKIHSDFNAHTNAYQTSHSGEWMRVDISALNDSHPLHYTFHDGCNWIVLKYFAGM